MSDLAWTLLVGFTLTWTTAWLGHAIRADYRLRAMDIEGLHEQILVDRWCAEHGHTYKIVPTPTVYRCHNCGDVVESKPGWVGTKL